MTHWAPRYFLAAAIGSLLAFLVVQLVLHFGFGCHLCICR